MKLREKVALVTGGGSGIGRAICRRFHAEGAFVLVNDIAEEKASETIHELGLPEERALIADVSDPDGVGRMFGAIERLDILVNNAGIAEPDERWEALNRISEVRLEEIAATGFPSTDWDVTVTMDDATWRRMMAVHLDGTFFCTREALKLMKARGSIVNLSSIAALSGLPDAPHYAAAKAGILGFTRSVALEVASRGIRVNAVAPGFTDTPMTARLSPAVRRSRASAIPLGRWAAPDEIAAVVLFLASEDSSYVTGQCLSPNGGSLLT